MNYIIINNENLLFLEGSGLYDEEVNVKETTEDYIIF